MNQKLSTQPSQTNLGSKKIKRERMATILVLLSSFLPFLNNLIARFFNTKSMILDNVAGVRQLDVDDCIFFLSMPVAYLFIAIGAIYEANKKSFYAVFISCYFQLAFIIKFIILDVNDILFFSELGLLCLFIAIGILLIKTEKRIKEEKIAEDFRNKTLDRFSSILMNKEYKEND